MYFVSFTYIKRSISVSSPPSFLPSLLPPPPRWIPSLSFWFQESWWKNRCLHSHWKVLPWSNLNPLRVLSLIVHTWNERHSAFQLEISWVYFSRISFHSLFKFEKGNFLDYFLIHRADYTTSSFRKKLKIVNSSTKCNFDAWSIHWLRLIFNFSNT